jgi:hypothetical protein
VRKCISHPLECENEKSHHWSPVISHEPQASERLPVTCGEIFRSHTTKDVKCIFSHDNTQKGSKIPFLNRLSLNFVWHHAKLFTSDIGAQKVVPRIVTSLVAMYIDV